MKPKIRRQTARWPQDEGRLKRIRMSRMQIFRSKKLKIAGAGIVAVVAVIGLIRCVPSDQAVITDDVVSEKVKEAEAAEEAEAQAMRVAHGEEEDAPAHGHEKPAGHKDDHKAEHSEKSAKAKPAHADHKADHKADAKTEKKAEQVEHKAEKAHAAPKHEAKSEPKVEHKKEGAHHAPKTASWGKPATETKHAEPAHVERAPASKPASGPQYVVQVGAFRVKDNAEKLQAKLKDAGFPVRMQTISHSKNGDLFVVRFEPTSNRAEADASAAQLKAKESMTAAVLKLKADE